MVRPKSVLDVRARRSESVFRERRALINLFRPVTIRIPLALFAKGVIFGGAFLYLAFGSVTAPVQTDHFVAAAQENGGGRSDAEERQSLERQLMDLESQIVEHEGTIQTLRSQGKTLQSEINQLNAKVSKLNLQIKAVNLSLAKLDREIAENTTEIKTTEEKLEFNRSALTRAVQDVYESDRATLLEVLLRSPRLSDFFGDVNNLFEVQSSLASTIEKIDDLKTELVEEKEALALKKNDAETLKAYRDAQRRSLEATKKEKAGVLTATKGKESKYQDLLKATRKTAAQIRSRIFELLGGGELKFDEAYRFAKFAEQATGVRAALILAVLDRESALGQNVGRCKYNEINQQTGRPAMHPVRDLALFLSLTQELGINPDTVMVSCANSDGAYGGAMGPAQFIPSTWNLYRDKIAEITGSNPPSPWKHADAFVAAAVYLKDAGASSNERNAAARYYCGARWNRYVCTSVYGRKVVERAQQFQQDINILNS